MEIKKGDIYLNKWASEDNPARIFIATSVNGRYLYGMYEDKGRLYNTRSYYNEVKKDTEHFVKIGSCNYMKFIHDALVKAKKGE